uniref:EGF-like domain-containing protein n=1 Tax=Meloidogyne enterolobii TaxID=390850 RepID=A0A6V7VE18_MELEN|nr:unnamed protein product [Meloidogyne enterolobii]
MSRKFYFLLLIILSFYFIYSAKPSIKPKKKQAVVSDDEPNLYIFNENFVQEMENSLMNLTSFNHVRSRLAKLGKIALYLRLYRTWIYSPASGHRGFHRYNPYPPVTFHPYIYGNCSNPNNFMSCIDTLFENIQQRSKFMFPKAYQKAETFIIEEEDFLHKVTNTKFNFDFSASYFLCFLTKNRVSFLARLPFCSYGFEEHQIHEWPAMAFRQFEDSPELWRFGRNISLDPIDHFSNQIDFECADVSFCPDPCCGRNSTRFFREGDTHNYAFDDDISATFNDSIQNYTKKMTRNERKFGWCAHSTCSLKGKRHIDYSETKEYFEDKKLQEEIQKRNRKNKNIKNGTEGEDQIIKILLRRETSTHYCYLEEPFNDDFLGIMENRWNLSCACVFPNNSIDHSKLYRFDVLECVDVNECIFEECPYPEQCVNMVDRYVCACPPGYYRQKVDITNEKIVKNEKEEGKRMKELV